MRKDNRAEFKFKINVNNKDIFITPYTTKMEKNILIMSAMKEYDIDEILRILGIDELILSTLSENEKKVILYKFREVSLGDEVQIKFKCENCSTTTETELYVSDFIVEAELNDDDVLKLDKEVTEENLNEFLKTEIDILNLDVDVLEKLTQRVKKNQNVFNFNKSVKCLKCKKEHLFYVGDPSYIVEQLSDQTLHSLYKTYNNMMMFGNMSKDDIDSLYPFERTIFIGLITKTKEEISK